jgi:hypothetical protein
MSKYHLEPSCCVNISWCRTVQVTEPTYSVTTVSAANLDVFLIVTILLWAVWSPCVHFSHLVSFFLHIWMLI